jgi:protein gp37
MAEDSKIEWCDHTFNPWIGCTKVSSGCDHCYAEQRMDKRLHIVQWGAGQPRKRTSVSNWRDPVKWNARHATFFAEHGRKQRVFCASLADVFDNAVDPAWRMDLFSLIAATPNLDWLLLTKRIGNVMPMCSGDGLMFDMICNRVWLGATVVSQEETDRDIPKLLEVPAAKRFLSMEPLLGPVDIDKYLDPWTCSNCGHHGSEADSGACRCDDCNIEAIYDASIGSARCPSCGKDDGTHDRVGNSCPACEWVHGWSRDYGFMFDSEKPSLIDWVIVGGESGAGARPMHPDWARSVRDQCQAAGVPFLFKQWGEWLPGHHYTPELQERDSDLAQSRYPCAQLHEDEQTLDWHIGYVLSNEVWDDGALWRVGKKAAGRLLDGVEHNEFPETA